MNSALLVQVWANVCCCRYKSITISCIPLCVIALIIVIIILWRAVACWVRTEVLMDWEKLEGRNKKIE